MEPIGSGPTFASGQPDEGPEGAGGACGSCGRALPPPDLEGVAASIDQTLSMETGRMVPRTAWAGHAPDGAMDALFSWLPSVKARRQLWERGQQLWTEQMTAALSGPCEDCQGQASVMPPGATIMQPHQDLQSEPVRGPAAQPRTSPLSYDSATVATPGGADQSRDQVQPRPVPLDEGRTTAMPAFSESVEAPAQPFDSAPTSAMPSFSSFGGSVPAAQGGEAPPPVPVPDSDEHESHTVILSAVPSLRTATRLVVLEGPVHGRQFSLGRPMTTIGRSIGCHVTVEADAVAYDHARVVRSGDAWRIELIGGADEILVNDDPVGDSRTLRDGDVIRIGPARFRFESTSQAG
jgi:type III secretion system (T3SS) inner membrane Yop/YscD-like protein